MSCILMVALALFLLIFGAFPSSSWASIDSGSILSTVIDNNNNNNKGDQPDFAVDLNATNFDAVLRDTPSTHAIVQFSANWCPACRMYKPHYEKVVRLFNGPEAVHPGIILMTRVDCALKVNKELCERFSVVHYPMLLWGPSSKFVAGDWKPRQDKSEILAIDDRRTADRLLNWINKQMGSSFGLADAVGFDEGLELENGSAVSSG
ncbi:sulfhydryl oxidase 2-like isoform X2 [Camellia sinensis]|uniref:sulfhydryl oxidase 2-like isoform X1 n=1 Tax=Camellia sinensis TaxID=4442 RepID=UPI0010369984|nr:sulfhydryl oxidase 2-like isoform X1 [Camellia sinensis]XP_028119625.1 sulfhydryl oxidase 2-like isoform X2 [Camellia sinensis]